MKQGTRASSVIQGVTIALALLGQQGCAKSRVSLEASEVFVGFDDGDRAVFALTLTNTGSAEARELAGTASVRSDDNATAITKESIRISSLKAGESTLLSFGIGSKDLAPGRRYRLDLNGTFSEQRVERSFTLEQSWRLPAKSPGEAVASRSSSEARRVSGGGLPPQRPNMPDNVNKRRSPRLVPTGVSRRLESSKPTVVRAAGPNETRIRFAGNRPVPIGASTSAEPSGASGSGSVLVSVNSTAAYSSDDAASFSPMDPTTIFPNNVDGGFCCDQIIHYAPAIDRFVWLMQFASVQGGSNRVRLAAASPSDLKRSAGTAWTYWDITATQLGYGAVVDFPDVSVGSESLYISFTQGPGLVVVRVPLAEIRDAVTINFLYTDPAFSTAAFFSHLAQDARNEIVWAGHNTNSSLRVFSWLETSDAYAWRDVPIGSWPNDQTTLMSITPDGQDWLAYLRRNGTFIPGSARAVHGHADHLWFAWTAPAGAGFPQAHVQMVALDRNRDFGLISQMQIWNPDFAFAYPALMANVNGDLGLSLESGGGASFENHVVGFWGDYVLYSTTASTVGSTRFGDYVTLRHHGSDLLNFDAFGFGLTQTKFGVPKVDVRYVTFGR